MRSSFPNSPILACVLVGVLWTGQNASGQILNLSTDLVSKGIATSNMTPDMPSLDARPLFEAGVAYASSHHFATVTAARGRYYFLSLHSPYQHVYLDAPANITIDLQHSDLYFAQGNIMAVDVANAVNVALRNFTVDYLQLPFTQLRVTGVNPFSAPPTVNFTSLAGYALPASFNALTVPSGYLNNGYFAFVFRDGQLLPSTGRMSVIAPLNNSTLQLAATEPWTKSTELSTILPGDTLVLEWRAGLGAIHATGSTGFTVQNVSVYASGFIGVDTNLGSAVTVSQVQVIPRPGTDRLISSNADGIHLSKAAANNLVANNTVKRTCDDAIAIDGQWYAAVTNVYSGTSVQVARNNVGTLAINQAFDFINISNASIAGSAVILDENPPLSAQTGAAGELITLTLDHALPGLLAGFGVTPHDLNFLGSGTVTRDDLAQEIVFGRGIYPAGVANVIIKDNMTESTNRTGIIVEQDEGTSYDYKTGPSSGITINNNIVDNALGYGIPSAGVLTDAAGINVVAYDENFNWVSTQSLTGISVTNNFVTNGIRSGVRVENVNGGAIYHNAVLNYGTKPDRALWYSPVCPICETLTQIETDFTQPVLTDNSTALAVTFNPTTWPLVQNRSVVDGSYRLAPQSIAVASGHNFTKATATAHGPVLPNTLAGLTVSVKDSGGVSRLAGLYYASPNEVRYVVPANTAPGVAFVTVGTQASGALVSYLAPGLFSADGTGSGVAMARAERLTTSGTRIPESVLKCSPTCVAVPIDLGKPSDTVLVYFRATGLRALASLGDIVAEVAGVFAPVQAVGEWPGPEPGVDMLTVTIPHTLAGAGTVPLVVTANGFTANVVTLNIM